VPFVRPTLAELIDRVRGDLRGRLEIEGPLLRRAMADVLGAVWGGAVHLAYGYLDWLSRQLFGDKSEREHLVREAGMHGITPVPAEFATGNVTATGTNGQPIPAGTILRLDAATAYRVTTGQVIAGGTATLPVQAVLAGDDANIPAGTTLTFESPIAGVNSSATVTAGDIDGGVDEEGTEQLRARYLLHLRQKPTGGSDQDYIGWALEVAGVTRAWVYRHELGLGTVVVRFVRDGESPIFPDASEVAAVQTKLAVAFTIDITPDNADTRAAVTAELTDLFTRVAEPGDGAGRGKVLLSQIRTAIGIAEGVTDYALTAPAADVVPGVGQLPTVGAITWT
jgi:uncharacterized phage protein gp47/JayE